MKKIEAVIRPFTVDDVKDALMALGVGGITVTEVRGSGHESDRIRDHPDAEDPADHLIPKAAVEVVVGDDLVASVVSAICQVARTGLAGDGKVFILPVSAAIRIRTGEAGEAVLF
jgi:nitrogen regulatory protein P-II 1